MVKKSFKVSDKSVPKVVCEDLVYTLRDSSSIDDLQNKVLFLEKKISDMKELVDKLSPLATLITLSENPTLVNSCNNNLKLDDIYICDKIFNFISSETYQRFVRSFNVIASRIPKQVELDFVKDIFLRVAGMQSTSCHVTRLRSNNKCKSDTVMFKFSDPKEAKLFVSKAKLIKHMPLFNKTNLFIDKTPVERKCSKNAVITDVDYGTQQNIGTIDESNKGSDHFVTCNVEKNSGSLQSTHPVNRKYLKARRRMANSKPVVSEELLRKVDTKKIGLLGSPPSKILSYISPTNDSLLGLPPLRPINKILGVKHFNPLCLSPILHFNSSHIYRNSFLDLQWIKNWSPWTTMPS